ncbi:unnamed protein product [Cuscuta campestris]|uniref:Protein FAR1-RELATED SEQUENCE n=1 Tax=Cuscuta campestris TaxID=132261 RepID=A0A484NAE9_9ASTE|nr:unnamed protein product [Cuscuta campestris]
MWRCNRKLPDHIKRRLEMNDTAGIPLHKSFNSAVVEAGGDLDDDSKLKNLFWAEKRSRLAYKYCGDIVTFDTIYLTNKNKVKFLPDQYILDRWRRDVCRTYTRVPIDYDGLSCSPEQTRYDIMCTQFQELANLVADDEEHSNEETEWIRDKVLLSRSWKAKNTCLMDVIIDDPNLPTIIDPACSKRKGAPHKLRLKSTVEKKSQKRKINKKGKGNGAKELPSQHSSEASPHVLVAPQAWDVSATSMEEGKNLENYIVQRLLDELRTYEHELEKKKEEEQVTPYPTALMTNPRVTISEGTCPRSCDTPSTNQPPSSRTENYEEEFAMMVKQFRKFKKFFKKTDSTRRPSRGMLQVSNSPPESHLCYKRRKPGHWKSACPYPKVEKYGEGERNEKKKKAMVAAESDESSSSSSNEEALVCMERITEKSNHEDRWTMSEDDTLCLMAKDDADQEVTSQTSCSSSYEDLLTSESLFDKFKKIMEDFEEINFKHSSFKEENKLLSDENLTLTKGRKSQLIEITQLKNGREGLGFDPSNSKRKGRTTFIPPKPTAKHNKQKGKEKEKAKRSFQKGYSPEFCKDMASLKSISPNEVILTGKRIRNIYEVMWENVKEACLIGKGVSVCGGKERKRKQNRAGARRWSPPVPKPLVALRTTISPPFDSLTCFV